MKPDSVYSHVSYHRQVPGHKCHGGKLTNGIYYSLVLTTSQQAIITSQFPDYIFLNTTDCGGNGLMMGTMIYSHDKSQYGCRD